MNLHGIVAPLINAVNPFVQARIEVSTGNATAADGSRVPAYAKPVYVMVQVQPITGGEIRQLEGLNLQGEFTGIYLSGHIDGLVRPQNKGGDKITLPDGKVYLVTTVLEDWPDWMKVAVTLQNGG